MSIDSYTLADAFSAKSALANASSISTQAKNLAAQIQGPSFKAPWELPKKQQTPPPSYSKAMTLTNFIDQNTKDVKSAGNDKDSKALFTLFQALTSLQAIATHAAADDTPEASLSSANAKFMQGISQIGAFIQSAPLKNLGLFADKGSYSVTTAAGLGKTTTSYTGKSVQTGAIGDAISGVAGNETFDIVLTKNYPDAPAVSNTITVNLANISGSVNLRTIVDEANAQIAAIKDADGNSIYSTKLSVSTDANGAHGITVGGGSALEKISFSAASQPQLYVAGTSISSDAGAKPQGTLTRITDIDGSGAIAGQDILSATDTAASALKKAVDDYLYVKPKYDFQKTATSSTTTPAANVTATINTSKTVTDSEGNVYMLATADGGAFDSQIVTASSQDVVLSKFDQNGQLLYSRALGASGSAEGFGLAVDANDNVIVAGRTDSALTQNDLFDGTDSFVAKFSKTGDRVFTYQIDNVATDGAFGVATDASGNIYVTGDTAGKISSTSGYAGSKDGYVLKLGSTGTLQGSAVFGGAGSESGRSIAIGGDGNLLVASVEDGNAVLRKIDANDLSSTLYTQSLGTLSGSIGAIKTDGASVYIGGTTSNGGIGGSATNAIAGGSDGFVAKLTDNGADASLDWTTFVGSTGADSISDFTVANGNVYVAGTTGGSIEGQTKRGTTDGFVARLDGATGAIGMVKDIGAALTTQTASGIAFSTHGDSILSKLGLPNGAVPIVDQTHDILTQTTAKEGDYFTISVNGAAPVKITLKADDTYKSLARRIQLAAYGKLTAENTFGKNGDELKIKANNITRIKLTAGANGKDLLAPLGLKEGMVLGSDILYNINPDPKKPKPVGGSYSLELTEGLNLSDKRNAKYALNQINQAISTVQRAFRSLTTDLASFKAQQNAKSQGAVSKILTDQVKNYQAGLNAFQAYGLGTTSSSTSFFG